MKKVDLKKLALLGLAGGIVLAKATLYAEVSPENQQIQILNLLAAQDSSSKSSSKSSNPSGATSAIDPNDGNLNYHLMSDDELLLELNADGQRMYNAMDASNKKLARDVASSRCANTNFCKGLNACKTDKNSCAGQASCKGQGKCGIADKNLAVRLVYNKMMKKNNASGEN